MLALIVRQPIAVRAFVICLPINNLDDQDKSCFGPARRFRGAQLTLSSAPSPPFVAVAADC